MMLWAKLLQGGYIGFYLKLCCGLYKEGGILCKGKVRDLNVGKCSLKFVGGYVKHMAAGGAAI